MINPYNVQFKNEPDRAKATRSQLENEISSNQSNLYARYRMTGYNPDLLVGKKGLEIYRKMKTDDQIKVSLSIKKFARVSTPWEIKPGDEKDKLSIEMADLIRYCFKKLPGSFEKALLGMMTAFEYGFSLTEKVYGIFKTGDFKGKIGLVKLGTREPFGYNFQLDQHNNILGITLDGIGGAGASTLGTPENPFPVDKFVVYSYNSECDNPYGTSDLRSAYRAWWSKDLNIKWWNIFNERFGMPTVVLKYPPTAKGLSKDAIGQLDDILKNIQAKSGFRIPDNIKAELLEATRRGEAGYGGAIDKFDMMIARAVLLPSLLGFQNQSSGSYALGKKHFDVFLFVLRMIGKDIEECLIGDQIIKPLIQMNYGEVSDSLMPRFEFENLEEEDVLSRSTIMKQLIDSGLIDKREEWVRDYLMLPTRDLTKYPHSTPIGEAPKPPAAIPGPGFNPADPNNPQRPGGNNPNNNPRPGSSPRNPANQNPNQPDLPKKDEFQLRREVRTFEQKVHFETLNNEMERFDLELKDSLQEVVVWWREDLLKKSRKILAEQDLKGVETIKLRYIGDFKNRLRDYLVKLHLDSKLSGLEELDAGGVPVTIKKKFSLQSIFAAKNVQPWEPLPPAEALDFFNRKVVVTVEDENGKKKRMSLGKASELSYYDKKSFTISGIEHDYIVKEAQMLLYNGLKNGTPKETMAAIEKVFEKYLDSGEIKDDKLVSPNRIETIVRTNTTEALNQGRMEMFKDPDVGDFVPYIMWSSILDARTTSYCAHMDGKIFRKDEPSAPPAHYNCRSVVVPVTKAEVKEAGGVEVNSWRKENGAVDRGTGFTRIAPILDPQNIVRCPVSTCGSEKIRVIEKTEAMTTYVCDTCKVKFRVSIDGDLAIYDPVGDIWIKQVLRS